MTKKELFDLKLNIGFRFSNSVNLFVLVEKLNSSQVVLQPKPKKVKNVLKFVFFKET